MAIRELVGELAEARAVVEAFEEDAEESRKALEQSEPWAKWREDAELVRAAKGRVDELDLQVRFEALSIYSEQQERRPAPGIEVKSWKVVIFGHDPVVLDWVLHNAPALTTVRWKELEKGLVSGVFTPPEQVAKVEEAPRVTIARDLGEYLAEG